jgi:hypothetical protein
MSNLKREDEFKQEFALPNVTSLISRDNFCRKLHEDNLYKFMHVLPKIVERNFQETPSGERLVAFMHLFRHFASPLVAAELTKSMEGQQSTDGQMADPEIRAFLDCISVRLPRHVMVKKSKIPNTLSIINTNKATVIELHYYNAGNLNNLTQLKSHLVRFREKIDHIFFAEWDYLHQHFQNSTFTDRKPVIPKAEVAGKTWTKADAQRLEKHLKLHPELTVDTSKFIISKAGKPLHGLSTLLFLANFEEKFRLTYLPPPIDSFIAHAAQRLTTEQVSRLVEQTSDIHMVRLFDSLKEVDCQYSKNFGCKADEFLPRELLINDFDDFEQLRGLKFQLMFDRMTKIITTGRARPSQKSTAFVAVDRADFLMALKYFSEQNKDESGEPEIKSSPMELQGKVAAIYALLEATVDPEASSLQPFADPNFEEKVRFFNDRIQGREFLGQGFSAQETQRCFHLRQIIKERSPA